MRATVLVFPLIALLAACDAEILSPTRKSSSVDAVAARSADALTLTVSAASASAINLGWNDGETRRNSENKPFRDC